MTESRGTLFDKKPFSESSRRSFEPAGYVDNLINTVSRDQILSLPAADVIEHLFDRLRIDPLIIYHDRKLVEDFEHHARVTSQWNHDEESFVSQFSPATDRFRILIPFTGDCFLWSLRPANYVPPFPKGEIREDSDRKSGTLVLDFAFTDEELDENSVLARVSREIETIDFYISSSTAEVNRHNTELRQFIQRSISQRRDRALRAKGIAYKLGIPLRRNPDAPPIEPVRMERRFITPLPSPPGRPFEPEPGIENEQYEHILNVTRHGLRTFEETPQTCSKLNEEDLRNLLLANLNSHYEGDASGETFRNKGRTDIRIGARDRTAFVAECKVWRGPSGFRSTIGQLLSYLTWRDSKAAVIVFNKRNQRFTNVRSKIDQELRAHSLSKRAVDGQQREGEWRFLFQSREDKRREVTVHVFAADLFVGASGSDPDLP